MHVSPTSGVSRRFLVLHYSTHRLVPVFVVHDHDAGRRRPPSSSQIPVVPRRRSAP